MYSRLGRSRRQSIQSIDAEIAKLKEEEATIRASISGVERRLESMPERQQEFSMVSRDRQSAKDLYDSLLKRYEEAQLVESMETDRQGERFRILEAAVPPEGPSAPNRPYLLILGVLAAIGLVRRRGAARRTVRFHVPLARRAADHSPLCRCWSRFHTSRSDEAARSVAPRWCRPRF